MTWRTDKVRLLVWGVTFLVSAVLVIIGTIAYDDHRQIASSANDINTLDERTEIMLDLQRETREDVKEILRRTK
jgi:hypothetical protein